MHEPEHRREIPPTHVFEIAPPRRKVRVNGAELQRVSRHSTPLMRAPTDTAREDAGLTANNTPAVTGSIGARTPQFAGREGALRPKVRVDSSRIPDVVHATSREHRDMTESSAARLSPTTGRAATSTDGPASKSRARWLAPAGLIVLSLVPIAAGAHRASPSWRAAARSPPRTRGSSTRPSRSSCTSSARACSSCSARCSSRRRCGGIAGTGSPGASSRPPACSPRVRRCG